MTDWQDSRNIWPTGGRYLGSTERRYLCSTGERWLGSNKGQWLSSTKLGGNAWAPLGEMPSSHLGRYLGSSGKDAWVPLKMPGLHWRKMPVFHWQEMHESHWRRCLDSTRGRCLGFPKEDTWASLGKYVWDLLGEIPKLYWRKMLEIHWEITWSFWKICILCQLQKGFHETVALAMHVYCVGLDTCSIC